MPCGTLPFTNNQSDKTDPIFTLCFLFVRKSMTQFIKDLSILSNSMLFKRILWLNLSKALPKSLCCYRLCSKTNNGMLVRASTVEEPFKDPKCIASSLDLIAFIIH